MKILCLNPSLSMRAYRQMKALHNRGHEITLLYIGYGGSVEKVEDNIWLSKKKIKWPRYPLAHIPYSLLPSKNRKYISNEVSRWDYDIIHSYSLPDVLGAAAGRYFDIPSVFDERDMVSAFQTDLILGNYIPSSLLKFKLIRWFGKKTFYRKVIKLEKEANLLNQGRVYVSDYTMELAKKKYNIPERNSIVFYNYALEEDLKEPKPKLSEIDGETHIVFEGALAFSGYRAPLFELFKKIAEMKIHIHIYGIGEKRVLEAYKKLNNKYPYYHYEGTLSYERLMEEMTKYDYGIIPFIPEGDETDHYHTMLPNKQFDYIACGLPLIVPESRSMMEFVEKEKAGFVFKTIEEIPSLIENDKSTIERRAYSLERHIGRIEKLYRSIERLR